MDIIDVPFHKFLGVQKSTTKDLASLDLEDLPQYKNHYGTVHVAAQFALAEAASGELLLQRFGKVADISVPIVRHAEVEFRRPAFGRLRAIAQPDEDALRRFGRDLNEKGTGAVQISVIVQNEKGETTISARFEWFVKRRETTVSP